MQAGAAMNPLVELSKFGQSPWYDNIRRSLISSGELKALVDNDGLKGVTSNPAIFEKAIAGSSDYDAALREFAGPWRHGRESALLSRWRLPRHPAPRRTCWPACIVTRISATAMWSLGSVAVPGQRHRGDDRGSASLVEAGGLRQRDDQGAGHSGRRAGDSRVDGRRDQHQCDAVVQHVRLRKSGGRLHGGPRGICEAGRRSVSRRERR